MKVVEDYLKYDLGRKDLSSWDEIRRAYAERAAHLVGRDYQSPSYATSGSSQAGSREGKIIANVNDYTRDQHDMARRYESLFARAYLPRIGALRPTPYITSSGMAALITIVVMLQRTHGVTQTILVGKHSYFQNWEALNNSFGKVVGFDETKEREWRELIEKEKPLAIFVDSLCNETKLTVPPILAIAELWRKQKGKHYLVVDNSLLALAFPWEQLVKKRNRRMTIVGWESLNKYYQYGLDRTTGGIVWASDTNTATALFHARMDAGVILSDIQTAMLPTPNKRILRLYMARLDRNAKIMVRELTELVGQGIKIVRARTGYGWDGPHVVIRYEQIQSYSKLRGKIATMMRNAKKEKIELVAGSSFGMPVTRVYVTGRQSGYVQMFLRISCGLEEEETIRQIARVIASSL